MKNPKSQEAKQTENVDDDNDDEEDSSEEETIDSDESDEEGVFGKEGADRDLSGYDEDSLEDPDVDNEDFLGAKQKSPVKRFTPREVLWNPRLTHQKKCLKMVFLHYPQTSSAMIVRSNCMDQN